MKIAEHVYKGIKSRRRKVVFDMIFDSIEGQKKPASWLDVGCATGDLIYFASSIYTNTRFLGVDISESLVDIASESSEGANVSFKVDDFFAHPEGSYDVITALAVSGYYSSEIDFLEPLVKSVSSNGNLFIHGLFNPHGLTVDVRWRKDDDWQYGLSQLSLEKSLLYLKESGFDVEVKKVEIKDHLPFNSEFPHRAYSIEHDEFYLANGCMIILPDYLLECKKCD